MRSLTRGLADETALPLLHVLVVEDDAEQREVTVGLLEGLGCRVDVAIDGAGAVRNVTSLEPDVVLMDLNMPTIDGWDAIRRIRGLAAARRPYIIVVSALADARSRQVAFDAGCNEYIVKPADVRAAVNAYVVRCGHRRLEELRP